jgi:hypothetical protein
MPAGTHDPHQRTDTAAQAHMIRTSMQTVSTRERAAFFRSSVHGAGVGVCRRGAQGGRGTSHSHPHLAFLSSGYRVLQAQAKTVRTSPFDAHSNLKRCQSRDAEKGAGWGVGVGVGVGLGSAARSEAALGKHVRTCARCHRRPTVHAVHTWMHTWDPTTDTEHLHPRFRSRSLNGLGWRTHGVQASRKRDPPRGDPTRTGCWHSSTPCRCKRTCITKVHGFSLAHGPPLPT